MQLEKKYYTVTDNETLELLYNHINNSDVIAVDTETSGLNPRKDKIVGWSVSGDEGIGFELAFDSSSLIFLRPIPLPKRRNSAPIMSSVGVRRIRVAVNWVWAEIACGELLQVSTCTRS